MQRSIEQPVRPAKLQHPPAVDSEAVVRQRLETIDEDAKTAEAWPVVRDRIRKQLQRTPRP